MHLRWCRDESKVKGVAQTSFNDGRRVYLILELSDIPESKFQRGEKSSMNFPDLETKRLNDIGDLQFYQTFVTRPCVGRIAHRRLGLPSILIVPRQIVLSDFMPNVQTLHVS
ncbi:uncharacterized protein EAF01_011443 [Botrytis porri]|uniref:Uncharacterized protein n=1 Tax=Botrytis porri TaxID=87229 RepID=A0A4Z1KVK7_9HELO|nr:uncharacterized protein EAF01_011443 [Botrytis porri]KAF7885378.1 hypothetical protein EAF01_011443 [Botrytis porri]TGO88540.1 hypothetical protein BPOR_0156g00070 [Botrytis porri]